MHASEASVRRAATGGRTAHGKREDSYTRAKRVLEESQQAGERRTTKRKTRACLFARVYGPLCSHVSVGDAFESECSGDGPGGSAGNV